ncbi:hypothetical protein [Cellulophaga baltica]|uniref:hypothetical protein n=1 Tax=Cellulophaga baltica TaxID=76594 RepID=UPI0015F47545|nr:hypothetical protein [Cellulophaga baltica]MBA6316257.1 hypothetical protein [Cellulophaga baltica]
MAKTTVSTDKLKELLKSTKIADRNKAVKIIQENKITELGDDLFNLLNKEYEKGKSWQLIVACMNTLGDINYVKSKDFLYEICKKNLEHDMITASASATYCRIAKNNNNDVKPVLNLISFGNFAVVNGALKSLAIDKVIPNDKEKLEIIKKIDLFTPKREVGYSDVRVGLVVACAGWLGLPEVDDFLSKVLEESDYQPLTKAAEMAIKGKYYNI